MNRFPPERLHEFCRRVFESFGISRRDADQAANILIVADLRGIDTHGVARIKSYVDLIESGRVNPQSEYPRRPRLARRGHGRRRQRAGNDRRQPGQRAGDGKGGASRRRLGGRLQYESLRHRRILPARGAQARPDRLRMTNTTSIVAPLWGAAAAAGHQSDRRRLSRPRRAADRDRHGDDLGRLRQSRKRHSPQREIPDGWAVDASKAAAPTNPHGRVTPAAPSCRWAPTRTAAATRAIACRRWSICCADRCRGPTGARSRRRSSCSRSPQEREVGKGIGHFFGALIRRGLHRPDRIQTPGRRLDPHVPRNKTGPRNRWAADSGRSRTAGRSRNPPSRGFRFSARSSTICGKFLAARACRSSKREADLVE